MIIQFIKKSWITKTLKSKIRYEDKIEDRNEKNEIIDIEIKNVENKKNGIKKYTNVNSISKN